MVITATARFCCMLAAIVVAGISPAFSATLLLQYGFDEADSGAVPAGDLGAPPPAAGVFSGGATRTADTPGDFSVGAADLTTPGGGTYVEGGDADKLDGLGSFTLTAWIKLFEAPLGNIRIMSKQAADSAFSGFTWNVADPITGVGTRTAASFGLRLFVGGENGFLFDPAATELSIDADAKWAFLAVSYDGETFSDNVNYYVGSEESSAALASTRSVGAGRTLSSTARFGVGFTDAAPAADTAPPGYLDDVRVYDGVLTAGEVEDVRMANIIPEPSSAILAGVGALSLMRRGRRAFESGICSTAFR
jgi:hypothetical protein